MNWSAKQHNRNVHGIDIVLDGADDEAFILLQSDCHFDSKCCNREALEHHLRQAEIRNAPVLDFGDWFDAMQGPNDRRGAKSAIRGEHLDDAYFDTLVNKSAEFLDPFKHLLVVRGKGNHETAVTKHYATDLTERLVTTMKHRGAQNIQTGGYGGYVRIQVRPSPGASTIAGFKLHYHHGAGGGGPVTRGVIQTNRQAVYLADADIVVNGHTHDGWILPIQRTILNAQNNVEHVAQTHVRIPGYKEEYKDGASGWHIERWGPPKPNGAAWLRFFRDRHGKIDYDVTLAK